MACGKDGFNGRLILDNRKGREALKPGKEALLEVLSKSTIWWRRYPFQRWSRTALSASIPAMVGLGRAEIMTYRFDKLALYLYISQYEHLSHRIFISNFQEDRPSPSRFEVNRFI